MVWIFAQKYCMVSSGAVPVSVDLDSASGMVRMFSLSPGQGQAQSHSPLPSPLILCLCSGSALPLALPWPWPCLGLALPHAEFADPVPTPPPPRSRLSHSRPRPSTMQLIQPQPPPSIPHPYHRSTSYDRALVTVPQTVGRMPLGVPQAQPRETPASKYKFTNTDRCSCYLDTVQCTYQCSVYSLRLQLCLFVILTRPRATEHNLK